MSLSKIVDTSYTQDVKKSTRPTESISVVKYARGMIIILSDMTYPFSGYTANRFGFMKPSELDIDLESSIVVVAEVVDATAIVVDGRGWL
ncbi:hypothetical protein Tco_1069279 [Tanacetum coccineum]|uniref:Uncharacterized protein n=1 Tax=Tanacetum coccineum TaxID=301880 RepID=A0ABQ5HK01_9ASTR